jgi:hypothetical protein
MEPAWLVAYLSELEGELRRRGVFEPRVVEEAQGHLLDAVEQACLQGLAPEEAQRRAVERFGAPQRVAAQFAAERQRRGMGQILGAVAAAGSLIVILATALLLRHRSSEPASLQTADAEFQRLRARFADQQPLLDMQERRAAPQPRTPRAASRLRTFHTVVFDTRGRQRLVRIAVPFWFGRRYAHHDRSFRWLGELTFLDDTEFDPEPIALSLSEVERHGPGLIADYRHASGGQFIAWVE